MTGHLISDDAGELIIEEEVSSQSVYIKKYQHPERPGGSSGITIGIGYDCGYSTPAQIRQDWSGRIPPEIIEVLATRAAGLTSNAAQNRLAEVRPKVVVSWEAAIDEFYSVEVPRWVAKCKKVLPNFDLLPPDCAGAIVSLAYNRGPSFTAAGPRYTEMRNIRALMVAKQFAKIPHEFRSMMRLWTSASVRGVATRREHEARLFERGLAAMPHGIADLSDDVVADDDETDQISAKAPVSEVDQDDVADDPVPPVDPAVAPTDSKVPLPANSDPILLGVQQRLKAMNYNPGMINGLWGGGLAGAISGFINDRGGFMTAPTSAQMFKATLVDLKAGMKEAEAEGFKRPVSVARATATNDVVASVAPEAVPVRRGFLASLWATISAFVLAAWDTVSDMVSSAWNFFTDHKDDLPASDSGIMTTIREHLANVPIGLWLLLIAGAFGFVTFMTYSGAQKIRKSVQSGERL